MAVCGGIVGSGCGCQVWYTYIHAGPFSVPTFLGLHGTAGSLGEGEVSVSGGGDIEVSPLSGAAFTTVRDLGFFQPCEDGIE